MGVKFPCVLNQIDCNYPIVLRWEYLHVSDDYEQSAHLLKSIQLHLFRFVKALQNKMSQAQSMGQSFKDL